MDLSLLENTSTRDGTGRATVVLYCHRVSLPTPETRSQVCLLRSDRAQVACSAPFIEPLLPTGSKSIGGWGKAPDIPVRQLYLDQNAA